MSGVIGEWNVEYDEEFNSVALGFNHTDEDGVEAFVTSLPRLAAITLGAALINAALELSDPENTP
jgi:hypothetical protein